MEGKLLPDRNSSFLVRSRTCSFLQRQGAPGPTQDRWFCSNGLFHPDCVTARLFALVGRYNKCGWYATAVDVRDCNGRIGSKDLSVFHTSSFSRMALDKCRSPTADTVTVSTHADATVNRIVIWHISKFPVWTDIAPHVDDGIDGVVPTTLRTLSRRPRNTWRSLGKQATHRRTACSLCASENRWQRHPVLASLPAAFASFQPSRWRGVSSMTQGASQEMLDHASVAETTKRTQLHHRPQAEYVKSGCGGNVQPDCCTMKLAAYALGAQQNATLFSCTRQDV